MSEEPQIVELVLTPVPPDSAQSIKQEIVPLIEATLRENGLENLLTSGQVSIQVEQTFPTDAETLAIIAIFGPMAKDTYKELILPLLKRKFGVEEKTRKKDDPGNSKDDKDSGKQKKGKQKEKGSE